MRMERWKSSSVFLLTSTMPFPIPLVVLFIQPIWQIDKKSYVGVYWDFSVHCHPFTVPFRQSPQLLDRSGLRIYECHIGMAGEDPEISSYSYFQYSVLPRIIKDGYNCIQFMAVVEHAYYASFGYHCNMFYATSSRYGTPTDFQVRSNPIRTSMLSSRT